MSGKATQLLSRQLLSSTRIASSPSHIRPARSFATTLQQRQAANPNESPSISNINPDDADSFNKKQHEFRANLSASKERADRQSSPSSASGSAPSVSASQAFPGESRGKSGLGSLSETGESREQREKREEAQWGGKKKNSAMSKLIYGTEEGRQMDQEIEQSFSQMLARGKYVHSIVMHDVKPDKVDEYVDLVGNWYPQVANNPENKVNLVGSWRTEVGDCDTFVHIWEYQRYHGYHDSLHTIWHRPEFTEFDRKLKHCINSKRTSLMQEFSFWPTTPPRQLGGLFELRSYTLHPGNLLEWETHWRKGLEARREVMEGVGAWFVQIGDLNTVYHLWQFADLEHRRVAREKSWSVEGWSDTVHKTVPLIQNMHSRIMIPMTWSPVG